MQMTNISRYALSYHIKLPKLISYLAVTNNINWKIIIIIKLKSANDKHFKICFKFYIKLSKQISYLAVTNNINLVKALCFQNTFKALLNNQLKIM